MLVQMNRTKRLLVAIALSCHLPVSVAEPEASTVTRELSYTYISIDYINFTRKLDSVSDTLEGDGFTIDLSYAVRPHIALTAAYNLSKADVANSKVSYQADIDSYRFGFLVHAAINDEADFIIGASFINGRAKVVSSDGTVDDVDEDGGMTTIGFRALAFDDIEFASFIQKNSIEERSSYSISFSASYYASDNVSLDIGYLLDSKDGSDLLSFGISRYF